MGDGPKIKYLSRVFIKKYQKKKMSTTKVSLLLLALIATSTINAASKAKSVASTNEEAKFEDSQDFMISSPFRKAFSNSCGLNCVRCVNHGARNALFAYARCEKCYKAGVINRGLPNQKCDVDTAIAGCLVHMSSQGHNVCDICDSDNHFFKNNKGGCVQCSTVTTTGFWNNFECVTKPTGMTALANCKLTTNNGAKCSICNTGFWQNSGVCNAVTANADCKTFKRNADKCIACVSGKVLGSTPTHENTCFTPTVTNCAIIQGNNVAECYQCMPGFYKKFTDKTCVAKAYLANC